MNDCPFVWQGCSGVWKFLLQLLCTGHATISELSWQVLPEILDALVWTQFCTSYLDTLIKVLWSIEMPKFTRVNRSWSCSKAVSLFLPPDARCTVQDKGRAAWCQICCYSKRPCGPVYLWTELHESNVSSESTLSEESDSWCCASIYCSIKARRMRLSERWAVLILWINPSLMEFRYSMIIST